MITPQPDYATTHFEHAEPTKITGEPKFSNLQLLHKECRVNAISVPSSNGGGNHGMLGAILSPRDYQVLSLNPFIVPHDPGTFVIPPDYNGTLEQLNIAKAQYQAMREEYDKYAAVVAAIKKFIAKAIQGLHILFEIYGPIDSCAPQVRIASLGGD